VYDRARALGLRTTAHAGEAAGAGSVRGALDVLGVERIGHGTRAGEDSRLLERLAESRVPLEMCPISNLRTGVVERIEEHPVLRYARQGLLVTVNTDDPKMFETDLATEYATLIDRLGATPDEVRALILNAAEASWLPPDRKRALTADLTADPAWTTPPG
jgi:adenosine deaminase